MKIDPRNVTVRDLTNGYKDSGDAGVVGFGGRLDIRPPYQREFVYKDAQRAKVIDTVRKGYPLNVMYWARNPDADAPTDDDKAKFEVLDGQQRTLSICTFVAGEFAIIDQDGNEQYFHSLPKDKQEAMLSYELTVYVCEGKPSEKLDWFKIINISGEKLSDQELLNAVHVGPWLAHAKRYFSKSGGPADAISSDYVSCATARQELLELALKWINSGNPGAYMAAHQQDPTAIELWSHFNSVINWVKATFTEPRKEMKTVDWGTLYRDHKDEKLDPATLEEKIETLMADDEVTKKPGIYAFVLDGEEKHLNIRAFTDSVKRSVFTQQAGMCKNPKCSKPGYKFKFEEMQGDHTIPWHLGGKTDIKNCQMLCKACNWQKGG